MQNRRKFIQRSLYGGALLLAGSFPFQSMAGERRRKLTILHTNDTHSRLDPFPQDGGKFAGCGGVAARAQLIEQIRKEEENVLLLDAGDIFQGTNYFNIYKGEPEIKAMTMMGYDACTMGNHDFDAGVEGFANQLPHARFPVLVANYDFTHTALENKIPPYTVINKGGLKIGLFGLGIELEGLVAASAYQQTKYLDPLPIANSISERLKKKEKCDMVICLSHLGYSYDTLKVSDKVLAQETHYIDLVIGGHTHTFLDNPVTVTNKSGGKTMINQVGWGGIKLGRLDFEFSGKKTNDFLNAQSVIVGKQTRG